MHHEMLFSVFVFLAAACIVLPLASRFRMGSVLGYIAAGVLIGPFGLQLIDNPQQIMDFAHFGVVMLLFLIGLELEPAMLWRMRRSIIGLGGAQMILTSLAFAGIGVLFNFGWHASLAVGMALAVSCTALVLQLLDERNLMHTPTGESSFSVLLLQDIAVIPILMVLPLLAMSVPDAGALDTTPGWMAAFPVWMHGVIAVSVIALVVLAGRYFSYHAFRAIARTRLRELFTATSLALIVGITLLMHLVGLSPALGAFIAGVVLANSPYRRTLEADIEPFKGLLLGLFFISIGMGMNFTLLSSAPITLFSVLLIVMVVKALVLLGLARVFGMESVHATGFAVLLAQGGEFSFVLLQYSGTLAIIPPQHADMLIMVVTLSIALTPLLVGLYARYVMPRYMSLLPEHSFDVVEEQHPIIIAGFGRFGQIIGRFLIGQGMKITVLEKDPEQIELLRKFGYMGYFGDAARLDMLRSAGAAKAKALIVTVDSPEDSLDIVRLAKEEFPHLVIFARARNRRHAYELHRAGVYYFKREMFDSSLAMAQEIMVWLGRKESDMQFKAMQFARHDEDTLRRSFEFMEDEPQMVNFARTRREELERILQDDAQPMPEGGKL
jgi:glutathione-regulated potassium-efflux system ancillary protein KefC